MRSRTTAGKKQAAMALGYDHAMFELVIDALKRSQDPTNRDAVRDAIRQTDLKTIVGQVNFQKGPFPNTAATPVVGGQWRKGKKWPLELALVDNTLAPMIPVTSEPGGNRILIDGLRRNGARGGTGRRSSGRLRVWVGVSQSKGNAA